MVFTINYTEIMERIQAETDQLHSPAKGNVPPPKNFYI